MANPEFSVIMATWNRGRHILPSIRSVLDQTLANFELLVIGDATEDDTEAHVRALGDGRIRWFNTDRRAGTQSGPNNLGLDKARAPRVAYLGHDDIWAADHLEALDSAYRANPEAGVVCSGVVLYVQKPDAPYRIEGLFEGLCGFGPDIFTPPSAFSHTREGLTLPHWKLREETDVSVDYAFEQALAEAGLRFASTGRITVHKVPANGRYLAYATQESDEQEHLRQRCRAPGFDTELRRMIQTAKDTGWYQRRTPASAPIRIDADRSDRIRGIVGIDCRPLGEGISFVQDDGPRGLDWRPAVAEESGWRWSGPSLTPKLQLNVVSGQAARIAIDLMVLERNGFPPFEVHVNGAALDYGLSPVTRMRQFLFARLSARVPLDPQAPSILEFRLPARPPSNRMSGRMSGIAVGPVEISPCSEAT